MIDDLFDRIVQDVYIRKITPDKLPPELYEAITAELLNGLNEGIGNIEAPAFNLVNHMEKNIYVFSAAKTFQEIHSLQSIIYDKGVIRPFSKVIELARPIWDDFNSNWLKTEVNMAVAGSQMAVKWSDITEMGKDFPMLKYVTVGDRRVRPEHKELDGIVADVNDPFWNNHYPPNGWGCRCTVTQHEADYKGLPIPEKLPKLPPLFNQNIGKTGYLFDPSHPYNLVADRYKILAANNFNLPIPEKLKDLPPLNEKPKEIISKNEAAIKDYAKETHKNIPAEFWAAFDNYQYPKLNLTSRGGAGYTNLIDTVSLNIKNPWCNSKPTIIHEYTHVLTHRKNIIADNGLFTAVNEDFKKLINNRLDKIDKKQLEKYHNIVTDNARTEKNEAKKYTLLTMRDIIGAYTRGTLPGQHKKSYWANKSNVYGEIAADSITYKFTGVQIDAVPKDFIDILTGLSDDIWNVLK